MKELCTIKSSPHGLTLVLDKEADFKTLIIEVCRKFADARDFFGETNLVLRVEGRELSGEELLVLVEAIEMNSMIHILLIEENDELKDVKMARKKEKFYFDRFYQNACIHPESVKKDDSLSTENSILILGDIQKGGSVRARGNIIVCGEIRGSASAGCEGENSAYIAAVSFDSSEISIAGHSGEMLKPKKSFFSPKKQEEPSVVALWEGTLLKEPLSGGIIKKLLTKRK